MRLFIRNAERPAVSHVLPDGENTEFTVVLTRDIGKRAAQDLGIEFQDPSALAEQIAKPYINARPARFFKRSIVENERVAVDCILSAGEIYFRVPSLVDFGTGAPRHKFGVIGIGKVLVENDRFAFLGGIEFIERAGVLAQALALGNRCLGRCGRKIDRYDFKGFKGGCVFQCGDVHDRDRSANR